MYPKQSSFRSSEPGSAWVFVGTVTDSPQVLTTQWDAVIRSLQRKLLTLLPATWSFNMATAAAGMGTARAREDVAVTGVWDAITAEGFCYVVACTFYPDEPTDMAALVASLPTAAAPEFSEAITSAIILTAFFLNAIGTPTTPANLTEDKAFQVAGSGFAVPANTVLPSLAAPVTSPDLDKDWYAIYRPVTDLAPVPPSVGQSLLNSAPKQVTSPSGSYSGLWVVGAALAGMGIGWAFGRKTSRWTLTTPRGPR